jgi:hypothetical protein
MVKKIGKTISQDEKKKDPIALHEKLFSDRVAFTIYTNLRLFR